MSNHLRIISPLILSLSFFASSALATIFVPINVGDITVIIPIDEVPVAVADETGLNVNEDVAATFDILANDRDEELAGIQSACVTEPYSNCALLTGVNASEAVVSFNNGLLAFQGATNWNGTTTFTYQLFDENRNASNLANVSVNVASVNDRPIANRDGYEDLTNVDRIISVEAHAWHEIDLLSNDYDPDGHAISIHEIRMPSPHSAVTIELTPDKKRLRFHSTLFRNGPFSVDYAIIDETGAINDVNGNKWASAKIHVTESSIPNELPVAPAIYSSIQVDAPPGSCNLDNFAEYSCILEIDVLNGATDPDGSDSALRINGLEGGAQAQTGVVNISSGGSFNYDGFTVQGILSFNGSTLQYRPKARLYGNEFDGNDRFFVILVDERGGTINRQINVVRTGSNNAPPQVSITSSNDTASYTASASVEVTASASDAGGISNVTFTLSGVSSETITDDSAPYSATFSGLAAGNYSVEALAIDNTGLGSSANIGFTVSPASGGGGGDPIPNTDPNRRVIYIHTDLLGSPAAETDEEENVIQ